MKQVGPAEPGRWEGEGEGVAGRAVSAPPLQRWYVYH